MPVVFDDQQQPAPPAARGKVVFDEPPKLEDTIPGQDGKLYNADGTEYVAPPQEAAPERSWLDDVGDMRITPDFDVRSLWTAIKGAPETGLSMANNAAAAGIAGITAPLVGADDDDSANYVRDFMAENSYTPQGESAQQLSSALGDAFAPIESGKHALGDTIMESTGSPAAATAGYMLPDLATILMGAPKGGAAGEAAAEVAPPRRAPVNRPNPQDPVATARAAGYKLLPSDIERVTLKKPGLGDRFAEAIAPEDVRRDFTIENQKPTQQLAREKVKAPEGAVLDETGIDKLREPHYQSYRDVEKAVEVVPPSEEYLFALDEATQRAGFQKKAKPTVTQVISSLRTKARQRMNNPNADAKIEQDGALDRDAADNLENALEKRLGELGDAEAMTKYREARQSLAELNDVDEAQQGGIVDASKLHRKDDKSQKRMTGQTKMAADINERFPDATKSSLSGAGKKAKGGDITREGVTKKLVKASVRGVVHTLDAVPRALTGKRPLGDRLLVKSEGFQNRLGPAANETERTYFEDYGKNPSVTNPHPLAEPGVGAPPNAAGVTPSKAVTLSKRLELEPEGVANPQKLPAKPDMLTADTPRATESGGVPFKSSKLGDDLAGDLDIDVRTGTKGAIGEKELSDLLADQGAGDTKVALREMEQVEFHPPSLEQPRRLDLERPSGTVGVNDKSGGKPTKPGRRIKVSDSGENLGDLLENNASGESSASVEAINRVKQEKKAGQDRFLIDLDDTTTPLTGVDAVDRRARRGQVIVQRGIGKDEYTILDRGGLSAAQAKGRIQAAFSRRE